MCGCSRHSTHMEVRGKFCMIGFSPIFMWLLRLEFRLPALVTSTCTLWDLFPPVLKFLIYHHHHQRRRGERESFVCTTYADPNGHSKLLSWGEGPAHMEAAGLPQKMPMNPRWKGNLREDGSPWTSPFASALSTSRLHRKHMATGPLINRLLQIRHLSASSNPLKGTASMAMLAKF